MFSETFTARKCFPMFLKFTILELYWESEHASSEKIFCEHEQFLWAWFEQWPNFAITFKLNGTIWFIACIAGVFLGRVSVTTFRQPIVHPLGRTFFPSPVFLWLKNSRWRHNVSRCERSHDKIRTIQYPFNGLNRPLEYAEGFKQALLRSHRSKF